MVSMVVGVLNAYVSFVDDIVLKEGDTNTPGLFFIHSGLIELRASCLRSQRLSKPVGTSKDGDAHGRESLEAAHGAVFAAIGSGSYFGDVSIFGNFSGHADGERRGLDQIGG